jgi:alpha-galactosidase
MGWNSWNKFQTSINEDLIKDIADSMIKNGYKDAGYSYIILDDGWMSMQRDKKGDLVPDPQKFPSGLKALSDYIHSKGLKFGIYNCAGDKTCAGYPGSHTHENQDAKMYAQWGVDYLKYDWCNTKDLKTQDAYTLMGNAILATKRPMVFSLCEWGISAPWAWAGKIAQLWRTSGDIYPCFDCEKRYETWSAWGIMKIVNMHQDIRKYAGPGHWNDPDMLEVGNGMSPAEDRSHFALWCMMSSPLIMGNDIRNASNQTISILTNKDIIAIDQDSLGVQAFRAYQKDSIDIWAKPLANKDWVLCFVNTGSQTKDLNFEWHLNPIIDKDFDYTLNLTSVILAVKDLYKNEIIGLTKKPLKASIAPHDILMVRLIKTKE